jgi:hypothetical protein
MKVSALSATVLTMAVLTASPTTAAPVHEYWVGTYILEGGGLNAMLRIEHSPARCDSSGCMWILVQGPGLAGEVAVDHIEPDGTRMVLRFPNGLIADCYRLHQVPAITGTLEWPGHRVGFLGLKQGVSLTSGRGSGSTHAASPDQVRAVARGTQSGPEPQFRGSVDATTERGGGQDSAQPVSLPSPPPGTDYDVWVTSMNDNLFAGISRLLKNDQNLLNIYFQAEDQIPRTAFDRAYFRADFIRRLVLNSNW